MSETASGSRANCLDRFAGHVRLIRFPAAREARGELVEVDHDLLPFLPRRTFIVRGVPVGEVRGGHAHRNCHQVLVCLHGRIAVDVASKAHQQQVVLDGPSPALYVNAGIWSSQRYEREGSILLVLCSQPFDADLYVSEPVL